MEAQISVEFEEATSRQSLNSGDKINALWGKVKRWLTDLKTVAFSGSYNDLSDKPTIPTVGNGTVTIKQGGTNKGSFTMNQSGNTTIELTDNDTTYSPATQSTNGLMLAEDKAKLDGIEVNANYTAVDAELSETSENPVQNKIINTALNNKADKSKYSDTTINVGRKADTTVGVYSTAEGNDTIASGDYSHTGGRHTKALHNYEVAYGEYNQSNDDTLFSIGDGTNDSARHNAFEITATGGKLHDKDIATTDLIPNEVTESTVSGWGFTKNNTTIKSTKISGTTDTSGNIRFSAVSNNKVPLFVAINNLFCTPFVSGTSYYVHIENKSGAVEGTAVSGNIYYVQL